MATYHARTLTLRKYNETTSETDEFIIDPMWGNEAACMDFTVNIPADGWTDEDDGTYSYVWENSHLTMNCIFDVNFQEGVENGLVGYLSCTKSTGQITFVTDEPVIGNVPVFVRVIDAAVSGHFPITADLVETDAVLGETDVQGALEDLNERVSIMENRFSVVNGKLCITYKREVTE